MITNEELFKLKDEYESKKIQIEHWAIEDGVWVVRKRTPNASVKQKEATRLKNLKMWKNKYHTGQ